MRAAIYARVSTEEQAEKYGLASQLTELRAFAARKGYAIPEGAEFLDDGHSGAELDRPALGRLRDAAHAGAFQVVLAHDPDRLSRRLVHQLILLDEFGRAGISVEFLGTPREDTAEGRLLLNVQGVIAEYEREKIRERTMRGKREKARRGLVPAGPTPYGYKQDPAGQGRLVVHEEEARVVRMIYRWFVDEGRSIRRIVTELGQLCIHAARGQAWAKSSVRRLLTSEVYIGRAWFNRRDRAAGGRFRPKREWIPVSVPAIVTPEVFEAAQRQFRRNAEILSGRPSASPYLLRGLLRCGECRRKFAGNLSRGRRSYRCSGRDRLVAEERCGVPELNADQIETLMWETVVNILKQPGFLEEKIGAYRKALGVREVEIASEAEYLARQLGDIERQGERLLDLYLNDRFPRVELEKRLKDLEGQKAALANRLAQVQQKAAAHAAEAAHRDAVVRYCHLALRGLDRLTADGRRQLLRALVDEVIVRGNCWEIHGILPGRWAPSPRGGNWSESQDVVTAAGGDLEGPLGVGLPADLREVHVVGGVLTLLGFWLGARRLDRPLAGQPLDRLA